MTRRRVIAYPMHEYEMSRVADDIESIDHNEAFNVGFLEDDQIDQLRGEGILVEVIDDIAPASTASMSRRSLGLDPGMMPAHEPGPPQPGELINWRLTIDRPLNEQLRSAIAAASGVVLEALGRFQYLIAGTTATVDALVGEPGVVDVSRHLGAEAAPVALRSAGRRPAVDASPQLGRNWDVVTAGPKWADAVQQWAEGQGLMSTRVSSTVVAVEVDPSSDLLGRLAHLAGVTSVMEHVEAELQNDRVRVLIELDDGTPSPVASRLDGTGQIIAVADTGVDVAHPDLVDRLAGTRPLGRPPIGNALGDASDPDGHGTHVAGTIVGTGAASSGLVRGMAPGAMLWFQSLYGGPGAKLAGLPADVGDLLNDAYLAGARVHNDSWGAFVRGAYDTRAVQIDDFVDKFPDMVVVVAAGNAGDASSPRIAPPGYPDQYSVTSPATAKNAISVGASRSDRTTTVTHRDFWPIEFPDPPTSDSLISGDPEALAGFSSRGPCDDERIKPDVVAPGTCILSTRSSRAPDAAFEALDPGNQYGLMSGTSMAAPVVAGSAALVRQYFETQFGHQPSAALVKATLVAGAQVLTGVDALLDGRGVPNPDQGFGRVNLAASLPDDGRGIAFIDTWSPVFQQLAFDRTGLRRRFEVDVTGPGSLTAVLTWTDRSGRSVQQDLGLFAELPDGSKSIGNENRAHRAFETDVENTVERIRIDEPSSGRYLFNIISRSLAFVDRPQHWALVVLGGFDGELEQRGIY